MGTRYAGGEKNSKLSLLLVGGLAVLLVLCVGSSCVNDARHGCSVAIISR